MTTPIKVISGSEDTCVKIWETNNSTFGAWSVDISATLNQHTEAVNCIEVLPNNLLASGSADMSVLVWSLDTYECVSELLGHWGSVECLCAFKENKLISGSTDKTIRVWSTGSDNECLMTLFGHTCGVTSLQVIEDHYLLSGAGLYSTIIWDLNNGNLLVHFKGQHYINGSPHLRLQVFKNDSLIFVTDDFNIKMWDLKEEAKVIPFNEIVSWKKTLQNRLISYEDHNIKMYDLSKHLTKSHPNVDLMLFAHTDVITALTVLGSDRLASGSVDHTINVWNLKTGECIRTLSGHVGPVSILEAINENTLISGSWDRTLRIWDLTSGECLKKLGGHEGHITCLKVITGDDLGESSELNERCSC